MLTVCILTKNASATLKQCLDALTSFPRILILDNGSEDGTLAIAKRYPNVEVHTSPFIGFGPLRNLAASLATTEWILALDSDEVLSPPLIEEIHHLKLDPKHTYSLPRHNFFQGKWIKGAGWHPERVVRLYHKEIACYSPMQVHEALLHEKTQVVPLCSPLLHTPYRTFSDFLVKMERYSTLFAKEHYGKKRSSLSIALAHSGFAFFKSYILQRGWLCGKQGLIISLYNAHTTFYKYLKLDELRKRSILPKARDF